QKGVDRMGEQRSPRDRTILLGRLAAGANAAPRRDDQRENLSHDPSTSPPICAFSRIASNASGGLSPALRRDKVASRGCRAIFAFSKDLRRWRQHSASES